MITIHDDDDNDKNGNDNRQGNHILDTVVAIAW